jgi:hypothetical protein
LIGVAISRILYGADIWCVSIYIAPEESKRKGSIHVIRKLIITQKGTSPTDALDAHASTLSMNLTVRTILFRTVVRFASLPDSHPLHRQYRLVGARKVKRHKLHHMMQLYGIKTNDIKTVPVVRQNLAKQY